VIEIDALGDIEADLAQHPGDRAGVIGRVRQRTRVDISPIADHQRDA